MLDHIKDLVGFAFAHGLWVRRVWYTRVYQNMTSNGGLTPRRLYGWLWPVEVARWLGSTLGDMNHKSMASFSMVCTFYMPCITSRNGQFGTTGCTGSCRLDKERGLQTTVSRGHQFRHPALQFAHFENMTPPFSFVFKILVQMGSASYIENF